MYGGVKGADVTDELWLYNTTAYGWTLVSSMAGHPLPAVGHTAHAINNSMYIIFGHNPVYGYLNTVQRFDFSE